MTVTTLKLQSEVRDRIKAVARREGVTVGKLLEELVALREREQRFVDIGEARLAMPVPYAEGYAEETGQWQAAELADGDHLSG